MLVDEIPTPALTVDYPTLLKNVESMAAYFAGRKAKLRPHFKAHKCLRIAELQLRQPDTIGLTCATVRELEILVEAGFEDILLANEVSGFDKARRIAAAARRASVTVAVDSDRQVDLLEQACSSAGSHCKVLVDVNVGMPRCGVRPEDAPRLAKLVERSEHLEFDGLMGYEGHCVLVEDRQSRTKATQAAMERLMAAKEAVESEGLEVRTVSAGGTGTYDITGNFEGVTEIQAGSYVLMDDAYAKLDLAFERGLYLLCTVISRPSEALAVADGGLKALSTDHGMPTVVDSPGSTVLFLSDEHASISVGAQSAEGADTVLAEGSKVRLSVAHIDPTINMHDELWITEDGEVVDVWPVVARGYASRAAVAGVSQAWKEGTDGVAS